MKNIIIGLLFFTHFSFAQFLYKATDSKIIFHAGTAMEDIDAENTKALSFLNLSNGEIIISIPNKDFIFKRALMQEHFNENYIETEKYPKIEFKGILNNFETLKSDTLKNAMLDCQGKLTLHGVSKQISIPVKITKLDNKILGESNFKIKFEEYKIQRPELLWQKLAEEVDVKALIKYEIYKK